MNSGGHIPLLAKEGWPRHQKMVPFRKGADGVVARKHWLVSDHPVCGASVAARLFIDAAATPPLQGGECAPLNSSTFVHTVFSRCLRIHTRKIRSIIRVAGAFVFRHVEICAQRPPLT